MELPVVGSGAAACRTATMRGALDGVGGEVRRLYVHVPFCFHKCHYCDFYSFVDSRDRQAEFTDRLLEELVALSRHAGVLGSVFVGGGTPSLLKPELWARLLDGLASRFSWGDGFEFTVECNPETVTAELVGVLASGGVSRVSIGAQSFDERHLKTLERWHEPANVRRSLELVRDAGIGRASVDLIFGVPGQTLGDWERDLGVVAGFADDGLIDHASCYSLTYEPNTAMTKRLERGEFAAIDEDVDVAMYEATVRALAGVGLERYEVSNYARPGRECEHNLGYWRGESWLAAGPSASGHAGGWRWKNVPRLTDWMAGVSASGGYAPVVEIEGPSRARAFAERVMLGLRVREGLDAAWLRREAEALCCGDAMRRVVDAMVDLGRLERAGDRVRLTEGGFLFADGVAAALMTVIDGADAGGVAEACGR